MIGKRCYVLYSDEAYLPTAEMCARSIREHSSIPIVAYIINSDAKIDVAGTESIRWNCEVREDESHRYIEDGDNFYINRSNESIYSMLRQRPLVVKHALENMAEEVAYIDADSIATKHADRIFDMRDSNLDYPSFVEGIYDVLFMNGRGGIYGDDYTRSLEHPACELFGVDQKVRRKYRQTGYFVADRKCIGFLQEWHEMCANQEVQDQCWLYAPFNEETIANVLLWKKMAFEGLPYMYVNIGATSVEETYSIGFSGEVNHVREWVAIPSNEEELLFFHGEKNPKNMQRIAEEIRKISK